MYRQVIVLSCLFLFCVWLPSLLRQGCSAPREAKMRIRIKRSLKALPWKDVEAGGAAAGPRSKTAARKAEGAAAGAAAGSARSAGSSARARCEKKQAEATPQRRRRTAEAAGSAGAAAETNMATLADLRGLRQVQAIVCAGATNEAVIEAGADAGYDVTGAIAEAAAAAAAAGAATAGAAAAGTAGAAAEAGAAAAKKREETRLDAHVNG